MSDPSPTGAVPPATPMVSPTFRGDGWNLSPAEQARVAATLAKHGISPPSSAPQAQAKPSAPPASATTPATVPQHDTFAPPASPATGARRDSESSLLVKLAHSVAQKVHGLLCPDPANLNHRRHPHKRESHVD